MSDTLIRTALYAAHLQAGARIVPFAGWEMPLQYRGILEEHRAVRNRMGIFDISHMGRISLRGPGALPLLQHILTVDVRKIAPGRAKYSVVCQEEGGILDDVVLYRYGPERFVLVCNAANRERIIAWLHRWAPQFPSITPVDRTLDSAMIALQGPEAIALADRLCSDPPSRLRNYACLETTVMGKPAQVGRTGYTGEDGVEFIVAAEDGPALWDLLQQQGAACCGLGARDTLRLEAGMLLYGQDMNIDTNPYQVGLDRLVDLDKGAFVGCEALAQRKREGVDRTLVGLTMVDRGIPRHEYAILDGARVLGHVTSGGYAPTLDAAIALGFVPPSHATPGTALAIDIRGRALAAQVVPLPFYSRRR